jgi:membrane-anchored protein YejM (alkaline phosphatase superfamily)
MLPQGASIAAVGQLGLGSFVAFQQFAADGQWTFAVLFAFVLPLLAFADWRLAHLRSEEAGRTANHWLLLFSFALLAGGL